MKTLEKIKELKEKGMSYEALARICGLSFRTVYNWCKEKSVPSKNVLEIVGQRLHTWEASKLPSGDDNSELQELEKSGI